MFGSTALAARIERAESRLVADGARHAAGRGVADAFVRPLAGGVAVYAGAGAPFVKVAGLGFAGPIPEDELAEVEALYAERSAPVRAELANLAEPKCAALLSRRGYFLQNFENVLGQALPCAPVAPRPGVEVRPGADEDAADWMRALLDGFLHLDAQGVPSDESFEREAAETAMLDMTAVSGFTRYLARRNGALAGAASLARIDGVAILCGAATLPDHRRRGVQTALLARRLEDAARAGCDVAVVTTQPGSRSQENAQRQGFSLLYTRAVLVKQP